MADITRRFADEKELQTHLVTRTKEIRVGIDSCIKAIDGLIKTDTEKKAIAELTLAKRKAQEAKHWLGECLGQFGQELPAEYRDEAKTA